MSDLRDVFCPRWLVMDSETTGLLLPTTAPLNQQPQIIELALVEISVAGSEKLEIVGEHCWLINPGQPLPIQRPTKDSDTTRITGLTDAALEGKPQFGAILPAVVDICRGAQGLIAHNLPFDLGMLVVELRRLGKEFAFPYPPDQLCTVAHYSQAFGRRPKLTEVYERVMGEPLPQTHRALDDTRALAAIVIKDRLAW